jgi:hypothetical protein
MATLTITIDDDVLARIRARAEEEQIAAEQLVTSLVSSTFGGNATARIDPETRAMINEIITEYKPVLDRLAQ